METQTAASIDELNFRYFDGALIVPVLAPLNHKNIEDAFNRLNTLANTFPSVYELLKRDYGNEQCDIHILFEVYDPEPKYSLDEYTFFEMAIKIPGIAWELAKYLRHVIRLRSYLAADGGICYKCWSNCETPFGEPASHILLRHKAEYLYIDIYIDFLRTNNLCCEINQSNIIQEIIDRHGWTPGTLKLAGIRAAECAGQHGFEQIEEFFNEYSLGSALNDPENFMHYFRPIVAYFCSDSSWINDQDMMCSFIEDAFPDTALYAEAMKRIIALGLLSPEFLKKLEA